MLSFLKPSSFFLPSFSSSSFDFFPPFGCLFFSKEKHQWVASDICANECAAVCLYLCLNVNILSECMCIFIGGFFFFVGVRTSVLCWLWLCWLWTRYQVTLVILECVDKNNETFANRSSAGRLKGLRWGLTLPGDIAFDQGGRWKRGWKAKNGQGDQERVEVSVPNVFLCQTNTPFWSK